MIENNIEKPYGNEAMFEEMATVSLVAYFRVKSEKFIYTTKNELNIKNTLKSANVRVYSRFKTFFAINKLYDKNK